MITIIFPPGGFGSTIEYSLRQFSQELPKSTAIVNDDGSMHSYKDSTRAKEFHPGYLNDFELLKTNSYQIATPGYPGLDRLLPVATVLKIKDKIKNLGPTIVICLDTIEIAERNELFLYHKLQSGDIYLNVVLKDKAKSWNPDYEYYTDMQKYELREALSFQIDYLTNFVDVRSVAEPDWLCITPDDILYNFEHTIIKMIDHCELTQDTTRDINEFYQLWYQKQQYIIEEFDLINDIVQSVNEDSISWPGLSTLGEAIVQARLRTQGLDMACYMVNDFPNTTSDLKKILIPKEK